MHVDSVTPTIFCRFCAAPLRDTFVHLEPSPLCKSFIAPGDVERMEPFYLLHVRICRACLLVAMPLRGVPGVPSLRTVGRILERSGILDGRRRVRRPAPPPGWYLPELAAHEAELDAFDVITGLLFFGTAHLDVPTGVSLHGGLVAAWPHPSATAPVNGGVLLDHWPSFGLPGFAQFDSPSWRAR